MNPDRRAEIGPQIQHGESILRLLPRELRISPLAARLFLATVTAAAGATALEIAQRFSQNTPAVVTVAEAAESCRIQVAFHVFTGIDMFPINGLGRPGKIDNTEDPKVGPGVSLIGEALAVEIVGANGNILGVAQIFRRDIPVDLRGRILTNPFDRDNPNLKEEGYGKTNIVETPCNRPGRQVQVGVRTSQNPKDQEPRIIKHGETLHELVGRSVETVDGIKKASQVLLPNDPRRKQIEEGLGNPEVVKRIDEEANRRRQERGEPTLTPTPTPARTETPTPTATRPAALTTATVTATPRAAPPTATRIPEAPTATATTTASPTPTPAAGGGIGLDLSGVKEIPGVGGIVQAGEFVLNLPAKAIDQFTEPDTQFPLRAGIDVLAWLALLTPLKLVKRLRYVGVPGAYILGTSLYPLRYGIAKRKYNRDVATAAAAVPPGAVPVWKRPTLSISI